MACSSGGGLAGRWNPGSRVRQRLPKNPRIAAGIRPLLRKRLSHNHHRFCSYTPVRTQSPLTDSVDPTLLHAGEEGSEFEQFTMRDVKAHATVMFAFVLFDPIETLRRSSDEERIR